LCPCDTAHASPTAQINIPERIASVLADRSGSQHVSLGYELLGFWVYQRLVNGSPERILVLEILARLLFDLLSVSAHGD